MLLLSATSARAASDHVVHALRITTLSTMLAGATAGRAACARWSARRDRIKIVSCQRGEQPIGFAIIPTA
jgi:hypothetical protein